MAEPAAPAPQSSPERSPRCSARACSTCWPPAASMDSCCGWRPTDAAASGTVSPRSVGAATAPAEAPACRLVPTAWSTASSCCSAVDGASAVGPVDAEPLVPNGVAEEPDGVGGGLCSAAGSRGGSACLVGDLEVAGSWSGVMSMCHRTASGGSAPQIGSSRDSAGSCLGAVSRNGHSRD